MTWMLTATGATIDLRLVAPEQIRLADIAHHLAQLNRYTGACSRPYSVAEHSLLVCEIAEREIGIRSPSVLLAALLHDAHEAYTADLSSPMKQAIGAAWHEVENRVAWSVRRRFGVLVASTSAAKDIRWADLCALSTERAQLMPPCGPEWPVSVTHPPLGWARLDGRDAMAWQDWRQAFIDRFAELDYARSQQFATAADAERGAAYEGPFG
jgi:hypothetical protein